MNISESSSRGFPVRKRRSHRKSRAGCRNCKIRRIKCDETQPRCKNCISFLVECNYDPKAPDLHVSPNQDRGDPGVRVSMLSTTLTNETLLNTANSSLRGHYPANFKIDNVRLLNREDLDRLKRWHTRTVFTIGTPDTSLIYQLEISRLVCLHPYLMHAVLAMTAMHDRFLQSPKLPSFAHSTAIECYHHSSAAALFNAKLSSQIEPSDRNALWATAVLLSSMATFSVESSDPEELWPLAPPSPSQLEWLNMNQGLRVAWDIAEPISPGGLFHDLARNPHYSYFQSKMTSEPQPGIDGIPDTFINLCDLTPLSNAHNNSYHASVRMLSALLDVECTPFTMVRFLSFLALMQPRFKALLKNKDARAMLLLAYWYAKVCESQWWIKTRAVLECTAICVYLERYHSDDPRVMQMLEFPKARCRLPQEGGIAGHKNQ
ncbi:hypothetical protein VTN77DRAFT_8379 [Rasamsonia byssochlamydoides]|uniref:uncharacterized protein n=1 Tax=Rasamsonia byssochlamydoides TaxID=89139 RepID=UPI0037430FCB